MAQDRRSFLAILGSAAAAASIPARWSAHLLGPLDSAVKRDVRAWLDHSQEFGRLDSEKLSRALKHRDNMPPGHIKIASGARWQFVGPQDTLEPTPRIDFGEFPTTGRINAIAFDPSKLGTWYAGSSNGGVWKATNALRTSDPEWKPITDSWPILCVSSIAVDNSGQNVYVGTGDCPASGTLAMGVMKSPDAGTSWTNISPSGFSGSRISRVAIHPDSQSTILAAEFEPGGSIWISPDGGSEWKSVASSAASWLCIEFGVASNGKRSCYAIDTAGALSRSDNGGVSWTQLSTPVKATGTNRPQIACSPLTPGTLYLFSPADAKIWSHSDYGNGSPSTWTDITYNYGDILGQATTYNYCMACSSTTMNVEKKTDVLYVGAFGVWQMVLGTSKWYGVETSYPKTKTKDSNFHPPGHADMHALTISPFDPNMILIGNDGGVYSAQYGPIGFVVIAVNKNLAVSEVYNAAFAKSDPNTLLAGMQDTGTAAPNGSLTQWAHVGGGDGGSCVISPANSAVQFATSDFYDDHVLLYTTNAWKDSQAILSTQVKSPNATSLLIAKESPYIAPPLLLDPFNSNLLYVAGRYLYRFTISTGKWENRLGSQPLASKWEVKSVAIASTDGKTGNLIYTGSKVGEVWMSSDSGAKWTQITGNLPKTTGSNVTEVFAVSVNPKNANDVLVALHKSSGDGGLVWRCSDTTAASPN
jgi:hypothetical protein